VKHVEIVVGANLVFALLQICPVFAVSFIMLKKVHAGPEKFEIIFRIEKVTGGLQGTSWEVPGRGAKPVRAFGRLFVRAESADFSILISSPSTTRWEWPSRGA